MDIVNDNSVFGNFNKSSDEFIKSLESPSCRIVGGFARNNNIAPDTTIHPLTPDDLSPKVDFSQLTDRARKTIWRNRPRRPNSTASVVDTYIDSKGNEYFRFSNGAITKSPA